MNVQGNKHLLRIEGVNLSNVLDDTSEISIRRGSGLMLREAVIEVSKQFTELENISTGASVGLYVVSSSDPDEIESNVTSWLNKKYPYLTFVVDTEPYTSEIFKPSHEKLIAKNRYRQFQQMTLVAPLQVETATCCEMDQLHPTDDNPEKVKDKHVSASSRNRFNQGQKKRQQFYQQELDLSSDNNYYFTDDLTKLTKPSEDSQDFSNLNHKMAVIYLDGNSFGKIQKNCQTAGLLHAFDQTNQGYRRDFLMELVNKSESDPDMKRGSLIRLETLLWGGDEMIFVVPAWKGMEVIQFFYEFSKDWEYEGDKLTYAGGIVLCHHKTPISQAIKSAKDLAEEVKQMEGGRKNALFDYLVLESVDYPTQSIQEYWSLRYGKNTKKQLPALTPKQFQPDLDDTLAELPRGSIYDVGQHWVNHWKDASRATNKDLEDRINRFIEVDKEAYNTLFDRVFPLLSSVKDKSPNKQYENPAWLHLVELWDYLAPVNTKKGV